MAIVSVVTPVYNGEQYLRSCIESVLGQSYSDWEYIIVDNCSSDKSRSIAESYAKDKRIRIYSNDKLLPVTSSFNRAASLISSDARYLKFVCADDMLFKHCLELMVDIAERNPRVVLVGSYKIHGKQLIGDGPPFPKETMNGQEVCRWFFQGRVNILGSETSHLIRLPVNYVKGNLFDESFKNHSDTDLFIRLLKGDGILGFVHQVLTFTRVHEKSVGSTDSHRLGTGYIETLAMLLRHGPTFMTPEELRKLEAHHWKKYSPFLFRTFLNIRNRRVWNYHLDNWGKLGIRMTIAGIIKHVSWGAILTVLHPSDILKRIQRKVLMGAKQHSKLE